MQVTSFPVTLVESFMLSPKVKHFVFSCEESPSFNYLPGQFITVHFESGEKTLKRSYSIANVPQQEHRIEFAAGFVQDGPGTDYLFNLKPGDAINISGPFGRLVLKDESPQRYILVATSTGITPYRAMLDELGRRLQQTPNMQVVILQGVQRSNEILYKDDFLNFKNKYPQVDFRPYLSRTSVGELQQGEYTGYVQHAFPELNLNPEQDIVYLCGNPSMIDQAFDYLKEKGFTTQQVVREKYISSK